MSARKSKPPTKAETMARLADKTGLSKTEVASVFAALHDEVAANLRHHKQFAIPGLVKITAVHKKATKARPGRNPFTGEEITIKAKPARDVVRVRALKQLKDMV